MNTQTWIVLTLVIAAAAYLVRNLGRDMRAQDCASGCGGCASKACAQRDLEARQH